MSNLYQSLVHGITMVASRLNMVFSQHWAILFHEILFQPHTTPEIGKQVPKRYHWDTKTQVYRSDLPNFFVCCRLSKEMHGSIVYSHFYRMLISYSKCFAIHYSLTTADYCTFDKRNPSTFEQKSKFITNFGGLLCWSNFLF